MLFSSFHVMLWLTVAAFNASCNGHTIAKLARHESCCFRKEDERGIDGVMVVPDLNKKKVRIGTKVASDSIKQQEFEGSTARNEAHKKESDKMVLEVNEKAGSTQLPKPTLVDVDRY